MLRRGHSGLSKLSVQTSTATNLALVLAGGFLAFCLFVLSRSSTNNDAENVGDSCQSALPVLPANLEDYSLVPILGGRDKPDGLKSPFLVLLKTKEADEVAASGKLGRIALSMAALSGDVEAVKQIVNTKGPDGQFETNIDGANTRGYTALSNAVFRSRVDVAHALLGHGASVNVCGRHGESLLRQAASQGCIEVVEALLAAGAEVPSLYCGSTAAGPLVVKVLKENGVGGFLN